MEQHAVVGGFEAALLDDDLLLLLDLGELLDLLELLLLGLLLLELLDLLELELDLLEELLEEDDEGIGPVSSELESRSVNPTPVWLGAVFAGTTRMTHTAKPSLGSTLPILIGLSRAGDENPTPEGIWALLVSR